MEDCEEIIKLHTDGYGDDGYTMTYTEDEESYNTCIIASY